MNQIGFKNAGTVSDIFNRGIFSLLRGGAHNIGTPTTG